MLTQGTCNVVKRLHACEAERVWDVPQTPSDRLRLPILELPTMEIGARVNSNFSERQPPRECSGLRRVMEEFWAQENHEGQEDGEVKAVCDIRP